MWVLVAREYLEDPVVATMLDAESFSARRRTILVFFDPGDGKPVERLTVSRYGLAGLFEAKWNPEAQPDQWAALADIIAARNPKKIALNVSALSAICRWADGEPARWRARRAVARIARAGRAGRTARHRMAGNADSGRNGGVSAISSAPRMRSSRKGFRAKVITPGTTTTDDVVWWYRERIAGLKLGDLVPAVGQHHPRRDDGHAGWRCGHPAGRPVVGRFRHHLSRAQHRYPAYGLCAQARRESTPRRG